MAAINDLLKQISDPTLRSRLEQEVARISKNKKFGLVFEEHIPECTPLYSVAIKRGASVARKSGRINDVFTVIRIDKNSALCRHKILGTTEEIMLSELVVVAQFGDPIFPTLQPVDFVENATDSDLWHTLIEADNYHALQLLEYLYPKQVDCIYIDPPYNTGARDWKYNNDYVDASDSYRHSKWLSMMKKRLHIAKKLLNPDNSVLICTIDEKEYLHLGSLLEELFPESRMQMITSVISSQGSTREGLFSRADEYIFFVFLGDAEVVKSDDDMLNEGLSSTKSQLWFQFVRTGKGNLREDSKSLFYPIFADPVTGTIKSIGNSIPLSVPRESIETPDGQLVIWPMTSDGREARWRTGIEVAKRRLAKGLLRLGKTSKKNSGWSVLTVNEGTEKRIENGEIIIEGFDKAGAAILIEKAGGSLRAPKTVWNKISHNAGWHGSKLLSKILIDKNFPYPKSLYAVKDALQIVTQNKNALIVDFFSGSGTTLHAVNLLNVEDNGERRCIIVTNNEVSEDESRDLYLNGYQPGDIEWERIGICKSVTWPRTKYSVLGKRDDGSLIEGEYYTTLTDEIAKPRTIKKLDFVTSAMLNTPAKKKQLVSLFGKDKLAQSLVKAESKFIVSEKHSISILFDDTAIDEWLEALQDQEHIREFYVVTQSTQIFNGIKDRIQETLGDFTSQEQVKRPMSEGFPANVEFFKLDFLDKDSVSLGRQFREILPLLWMKSGAIGKRPEINVDSEPEMMILPQNRFAILIDETKYSIFAQELSGVESIETVYFVTNSQDAFREMSSGVKAQHTYQLYRDYIDNFVIGSRRD